MNLTNLTIASMLNYDQGLLTYLRTVYPYASWYNDRWDDKNNPMPEEDKEWLLSEEVISNIAQSACDLNCINGQCNATSPSGEIYIWYYNQRLCNYLTMYKSCRENQFYGCDGEIIDHKCNGTEVSHITPVSAKEYTYDLIINSKFVIDMLRIQCRQDGTNCQNLFDNNGYPYEMSHYNMHQSIQLIYHMENSVCNENCLMDVNVGPDTVKLPDECIYKNAPGGYDFHVAHNDFLCRIVRSYNDCETHCNDSPFVTPSPTPWVDTPFPTPIDCGTLGENDSDKQIIISMSIGCVVLLLISIVITVKCTRKCDNHEDVSV